LLELPAPEEIVKERKFWLQVFCSEVCLVRSTTSVRCSVSVL